AAVGHARADAAQDGRREVVDVELLARPAPPPGRLVPARVAAEHGRGAERAARGKIVQPRAVRRARVAGVVEPLRRAEDAVQPGVEELRPVLGLGADLPLVRGIDGAHPGVVPWPRDTRPGAPDREDVVRQRRYMEGEAVEPLDDLPGAVLREPVVDDVRPAGKAPPERHAHRAVELEILLADAPQDAEGTLEAVLDRHGSVPDHPLVRTREADPARPAVEQARGPRGKP